MGIPIMKGKMLSHIGGVFPSRRGRSRCIGKYTLHTILIDRSHLKRCVYESKHALTNSDWLLGAGGLNFLFLGFWFSLFSLALIVLNYLNFTHMVFFTNKLHWSLLTFNHCMWLMADKSLIGWGSLSKRFHFYMEHDTERKVQGQIRGFILEPW